MKNYYMEFLNENWFENEFLSTDFDNILIQQNNPLINSDQFIQYKQIYLNASQANLQKFTELTTELRSMIEEKLQNTNPTKVVFTFIDEDKSIELEKNLNSLISKQRNLFNRFLHYVNDLNTNVNKYNPKSTNPSDNFVQDKVSIKSARSIKSTKSLKNKMSSFFKVR